MSGKVWRPVSRRELELDRKYAVSLILGAVATLLGAAVAALFHQLVLAAVLGGAAVVLAVIVIVVLVRVGLAGYRRLGSGRSSRRW